MASEYSAEIRWSRDGAAFTDGRYSRYHRWVFDGGTEVPASSSPHGVPEPLSVAAAVDPEEAFLAALSSCHMLFFLALAAKRGFVVETYVDRTTGILARNPAGRFFMESATLHPEVAFHGALPAAADFTAWHHRAHELCYIANSVLTEVRVEPRIIAGTTPAGAPGG
jgi:organic hydroperoxide reductase OsmC/OhrA